MEKFSIFAPEVFGKKYSIWKKAFTIQIFSDFLEKRLDLELQIAIFIDLLETLEDYNSGFFDSIDSYNRFLESVNVDGGIVQHLSNYEIEHFILDKKSIKQQFVLDKYFDNGIRELLSSVKLPYKGYVYPIVKSAEGDDLAAYNSVLVFEKPILNFADLIDSKEISLNSEGILFMNELSKTRLIYKEEDIFNWDQCCELLYIKMKEFFADYVCTGMCKLEDFNILYKNLLEIRDYGLRLSFKYLLDSYAIEVTELKQAKQCKFCGHLFPYKKLKLYCNEKCKISASNSRQYIKYHKKH